MKSHIDEDSEDGDFKDLWAETAFESLLDHFGFKPSGKVGQLNLPHPIRDPIYRYEGCNANVTAIIQSANRVRILTNWNTAQTTDKNFGIEEHLDHYLRDLLEIVNGDWGELARKVSSFDEKWDRIQEAEDDDESEISDFQKEMRAVNPSKLKEFLDDMMAHMDSLGGLWILVMYSDFSGTAIDRSNAACLLKKYPGIVKRIEGAAFGTVWTGIPDSALENIDAEALHSLMLDYQTIETEGVLDEEGWRQVQVDKKVETWVNWVAKNFKFVLLQRFPERNDELDAMAKGIGRQLWGLFDEAREASGQEWQEMAGADQHIDIDKVANAVTPEMFQRWYAGIPQAGPQIESLKRILAHVQATNPHTDYARNALFQTARSKWNWPDDPIPVAVNDPKLPDQIYPASKKDVLSYKSRPSEFPAIVLLDYGNRYGIADGSHRLEGARQRGDKIIMAFIGKPKQNESLMEARKYSCVMAPAPPELTDAVLRWGKMFIGDDELYIDEKDPEGYGREDEVHATVKFGLHEAEPSPELLKIIEQTQPFEIEVGPCTLFENEKYDVVKFDVDGDGLREMNRRISELPNSDEYPEYHPHMTVAYITKGCCHELIGTPLLDPQSEPDLRFLVKAVIFSSPNSTKTTLFLGKPNLEEGQQSRESGGTITYRSTDPEELNSSGVVEEFGDNAFGDFTHVGDQYLILKDGIPVGWFQDNESGGIHVIEVKPEYQQQGIATALLKQIYGDDPFSHSEPSEEGRRLFKRFPKAYQE